jgi:hyperosmotically inducible periplasmic protein
MARRTLLGVALIALVSSGCSAATQGFVQVVNDSVLTSTVKSRLASAKGLGTLTGVSVRTREDMVFLSGTVPDEQTRDRIDTLVRDIAGYNRVTNELRVSGRPAEARSH